MPRITKVYTRTGDDGTTGLGGGRRVAKDDLRIEAYGTVDELSSVLGVAVALGLDERLRPLMAAVQNELFHLGADLCYREEDKERYPGPRIEARHVEALETQMDALNDELEPLSNFVLPGGGPGAAHLHCARTVCRRAERCLVRLSSAEPIGEHTVPYLNRLSDLLFVAARYENHCEGRSDQVWNSRA